MYFADLDRHWSPHLLSGLQEGTLVPIEKLEAMTFHSWHGTLIGEDDGRMLLPWLPAIGNRQRIQSFGQQACPVCLAEDETPYLRSIWRVSCLPTCTEHECLLIDRCPNCASVIYPGNLTGSGKPISACWNCTFDLRKTPPTPNDLKDRNSLEPQILAALAGGWIVMGHFGRIHPLLFFLVMWRIFRILTAGMHAYPLRDYVCNTYSLNLQGRAIPALREVDKLNPRSRFALLQMASTLIEEWPTRFVTACEALGIRSRHLFKDRRNEPFALVDPIDNLPYGNPPKSNKLHLEEVKHHLAKRGIVPTQRQIRILSGRRPRSLSKIAEPAHEHIPYGQSRYWKLDGISPSARALAKQAAKREGEKVSAWVEKAIIETLSRDTERIDTSSARRLFKKAD